MSGPSDTKAEREQVRAAVRRLLEADRAAGRLQDVSAYKRPFPGFWDIASEEYEEFVRSLRENRIPPAGEGTTDPSPASAPPTIVSGAGASPSPGTGSERIGPYLLVKELGRGGMGIVYLAEDARFRRRVALKVLSPQFASSAQLKMRFRREAEVASRIDHPNICAVYDADVDGPIPYIAMRFVEGRTLHEWITAAGGPSGEAGGTCVRIPGPGDGEGAPEPAPGDAPPGGGPQAREGILRVVHLVEKAARALHVAHEAGLIHRDIKPHNIMVTREGDPVLLDFGLAREEEGEGHQLTLTGALMGTPAYMSPEQLMAQRIPLDRRTDVYSLGVSLYECLTLRLPFEAPTADALYQRILTTDPEDPRRLNRDIPPDLRVVLETVLEKNRERRYQTALDFAEELRRVRVHEPIRARPVGVSTRLLRWSERHPGMAASLVFAFLALGGGLAFSLFHWNRAQGFLQDASDAALSASLGEKQARRERDAKERALVESRRSLRTLRALALAAASREAEAEDGERSFLLAREAVRVHPTSETVSRLLEASLAPVAGAEIRVPGEGIETLVQDVAFSPDGSRVAAACWNGTARIHDLDGRELAVCRGHAPGSYVWTACFSADGTRILTASTDGTARLWNLGGDPLAVFHSADPSRAPEPHGKSFVRSARFSPDGTRVLTASLDGTARLFDLQGRELLVLRPEDGFCWSAIFSPDGSRILTGSESTAALWDLEGNRIAVLRGHVKGQTGGIDSLDFSPDGRRIVTGSRSDGAARLWDLRGSEIASIHGHEAIMTGAVTSVGFSRDGSRILTSGADSTFRLWDADGRSVAAVRVLPWSTQTGGVASATFSPDGTRVLLGCVDGSARIWSLGGGWNDEVQQAMVLTGHAETQAGGVRRASFSPDGRRIATAGADGKVRLWEFADREVGSSPPGEAPLAGPLPLTVGEDGVIRDPGGREIARARVPAVSVEAALLSPRGDRILLVLGDSRDSVRTARLFDRAGEGIWALRGVTGAAFSPSGEHVVTSHRVGPDRHWPVAHEDLLRRADERPVRGFTPEERARYGSLLAEPGDGAK